MASWQPNPIYGTPQGGDFIDDMGQTWPDPEGRLNEPTQAAPNMPAGGPGVAPLASNPLAMPAQAPMGPPAAPDPILAVGPNTPPPPPDPRTAHGSADRAAPVTPPAPGAPPPDPEQVKGASPFVSLSESKESTTGPSKQDRASQEANINSAQTAETKANKSAQTAELARADLMQQRGAAAVAAGLQGQIDTGRAIEAKNRILSEVNDRLNSDKVGGAGWTPDRTQIFEGGRGAAFGITAAIAAMCGGWMMGRGMTRNNIFLDSITKMIDDNVSDQVRKNTATFQQLREQKGDVGAAISALKQQQLGYVQQQLNGVAQGQDSQLVRVQAQAAYDKLDALKAQHRTEEEQKLLQTVTTEHSRHMAANPLAAAQHLPRPLVLRHANNNQFIREWSGLRAELKGLEQSGDLNGYLGTAATHGVSWVQEHLNGLPPGQQKAAILMSRLEELNHLHTGSTMVGLSAEEKERFGKVGVPQKMRDVGNTYQYFDQLARDKAEENHSFLQQAGAAGADAEPDDSGPEASY